MCCAILNIFFSFAFFSCFGAMENFDIEENWIGWRSEYGEPYRPCWRAVSAFTFLSGVWWLVSAFLAYRTPVNREPHHFVHRKPSAGSSTLAANEQV
ncbi:hypothetical protein A1O1_05488 [Capronia coronata CBS 617.96]|uniref:MARVEL domain-containing protein n=1 Tax=Capronia coronata CBS 617.96 TaxID=1182541 RepID=W9Y7Q3_9EURO|nr:uncharacterized protein A1O1_05488 [Capronia coronata CBS 617.96]EXJ88558.1 hypothetical protein A1O1_05488 [Capronia coronata CBS 617.96]